MIVLGDPIEYSIDGAGVTTRAGFLAGPHDRPAQNRPTGETHAVGIVTTAVGCAPVFGLAPATIRGQVREVAETWADGARLRSQISDVDDPDVVLDLVEDHLRSSAGGVDDRRRRCAAWVRRLAEHPTLAIGDLADDAGITHAHLVAEFNRHVGLTPRVLARILRLRAVIAAIDIEPTTPWTEIAHRHEWFDQAHFIRDFKRHTGVTPSAYVAAQRAAFLPDQPITGSGVGFVPET